MTVTHQIKILDKKIMQNEAQYDLDRKAAKISALSSNNLDKYEYLTGEDLGLKVSEYPLKIKNLKTAFCWFTVLLFDCNEGKMVFFLSKILFLNGM